MWLNVMWVCTTAWCGLAARLHNPGLLDCHSQVRMCLEFCMHNSCLCVAQCNNNLSTFLSLWDKVITSSLAGLASLFRKRECKRSRYSFRAGLHRFQPELFLVLISDMPFPQPSMLFTCLTAWPLYGLFYGFVSSLLFLGDQWQWYLHTIEHHHWK